MEFIPFAKPDIGDAEINSVVELLRTGWLTTGPKALEFEKNFASFLGADVECIAVNSATAGLHLALEAIGVNPGDEVITTTHTFTATAEVIRYLGAEPVFVDIDQHTLCIDPNAVRNALSSRTKAIVPVHFGGRAAPMNDLVRIASEYKLKIVEDAAHALPTSYNGKLVGSLGTDATVFSFYANKTITTGEGGMLVTRNADIARRARIMRLHGINRDAFSRFTSKTPSWYYEVVAPGYKYNLMDLSAVIGIEQLRKAHIFQKKRNSIAQFYNAQLSDLPVILPPGPENNDIHSWHLYVLRIQDADQNYRDALIERMFALGIGCSVHYIPLHNHPYWRDRYNLSKMMFPQSQKVFEQSISLPIYSKMDIQTARRVVCALKVALSK